MTLDERIEKLERVKVSSNSMAYIEAWDEAMAVIREQREALKVAEKANLRDYFASAALKGMALPILRSVEDEYGTVGAMAMQVANAAWCYADAVLARRERA